MSTIPFPGHHWARCTRKECHGCHLCHGGLAVCTVCGGLEGALPTDCPGERMDTDRIDAVYEGILDYRRNQGWVHEASPHSPAFYRTSK